MVFLFLLWKRDRETGGKLSISESDLAKEYIKSSSAEKVSCADLIINDTDESRRATKV